MPITSMNPSALTRASRTASMISSFFFSGFGVEPELGAHRAEFDDGLGLEVGAGDRRLRSRFTLRAAAAAAALAGACTHEFLTFSQSARNDSSPRSVSGCFTRFFSTANGTVAMSQPMSAACVTWLAERIDAAMTSTSCPKS